MSDDFEDTPAAAPAAKAARKKPAPRKAAKPKAEPVKEASFPLVESAPAPAETAPPRSSESESRDGGPEPIPFFVENSASDTPGNPKKRRRRKKKHGQSQQPQHPHAVASHPEAPPTAAPEGIPAPVMQAAPRPKLDADEVAKKAWKIFQSEVGEEGLALIDDHDAREISRRCFRLAEIFLEEAARRNR